MSPRKPSPPPPQFVSTVEMLAIANRIADLAGEGRTVRLLPATARTCEKALRAMALYPHRMHLIRILCGKDKCPMRRDCYSCYGKANEIMALFEGRGP